MARSTSSRCPEGQYVVKPSGGVDFVPLPRGAPDGRTVCLRSGPATCAKRVTDASGTWSVANDGTISLAPAAGFTGTAKATYEQTDATGGTVAAPVRFTIGAQPAADPRSVNRAQIPATGGPPPMLLTLGALLTALGATLAVISRRRSRQPSRE